jgi:hypothetical protein
MMLPCIFRESISIGHDGLFSNNFRFNHPINRRSIVQKLTALGSKTKKRTYKEMSIRKKVANGKHKRGDRNGLIVQKLLLAICLSEYIGSHRKQYHYPSKTGLLSWLLKLKLFLLTTKID